MDANVYDLPTFDLKEFQVNNLPPKLFYIPDFITEEEEQTLLRKIYESPLPKWVTLRGRRLQNWGGLPHPKGMVPDDIPKWLRIYMDRVSNLGLFDGKNANHVLINEYKPGQGIDPHHDGPLYHPVVTTLNLGSYGVLDFYSPIESQDCTSWTDRYIGSVLLEPRSLNVVTDQLYAYYMHGIALRMSDSLLPFGKYEPHMLKNGEALIYNLINKDSGAEPWNRTRETRISITMRHVLKVCKLDLRTIFSSS